MVSKALILMVAAKFNWYTTNHHVGQGHATNFITKIAGTMKIRCDTAPAGMAKTALLHSVIKLHHKNMLWLVAPGFDSVLHCTHEYQRFLNDVKTAKETRSVDPRMKNHEGRIYLTRKAIKHRIMDLMVPLGVIGSFLYHKCPSSTASASPLISVRN